MRCLAKDPENGRRPRPSCWSRSTQLTFISGDYFPPARPARKWGAAIAVFAVTAVIAFAVRSGGTSSAAPAPKPDSIAPAKAAAPPPAPTPALTPADSLAIAGAVERRMATRTAVAPSAPKIDSATLAAIRADVEKSVLDSLQKIRRPSPRGTRAGGAAASGLASRPIFRG